MIRWAIAVAFLCIVSTASPAAARTSDEQRIAAALEHAMAAHPTPAMSALVIRHGRAGREVVRGVRRLGEPRPVRTGELWQLGSDTKAMTATLIGRLVDRGLLAWTDRLDHLLPDLASEMRPEYRNVTLLDLLSHTAGLPDRLSDDAYVSSRHDDHRPMPEQRLAYIRKGLADTPIAAPRTRTSYSNTGFIIAAVIAERVGGRPYEELVNALVFRPLGMRSPTFDTPQGNDLGGHVNGRPAVEPYASNPAVFNGAGEVRMTMSDWAKFVIDQYRGARGEGRLLRRETYRTLQTAHQVGEEPGMALGWEVRDTAYGRAGPVLLHMGSDGIWISDVILYLENGNGLLIATNAGWDVGAQHALFAAIREIVVDLAPPANESPAR